MYGCVFVHVSSYYLDHNIWVNIFTVDSKWLYSLYWCMNVSSVTTNMCHEFAQMSSPVWHMVWRLYVQALLHHFMHFCSALLQLFLVELFFVLFVLLVYHWVCKPACLVPAQARINREGCGRNVIRRKNGGDDESGSQISLDGVAPSQIVGVYTSVIFPCTIKSISLFFWHWLTWVVQKRGSKTVVCVCVYWYQREA